MLANDSRVGLRELSSTDAANFRTTCSAPLGSNSCTNLIVVEGRPNQHTYSK